MKSKLLLLVMFISMIGVFSVGAAAQTVNFWDAIFGPFAGIEGAYDKFSTFIDFIVYLIIFIGVAQFTIGKVISKGMSSSKSSNAVVFGFGFMLALALALWEREANFNIKTFGPLAMAILIGICGAALYLALKAHEMETVKAFAWGYLLTFLGFAVFGIYKIISETDSLRLLASIMLLLVVAAVLILLGGFIRKMLGKIGGGGTGGGGGGLGLGGGPSEITGGGGGISGLGGGGLGLGGKPPEIGGGGKGISGLGKQIGKAGGKASAAIGRGEKYTIKERADFNALFEECVEWIKELRAFRYRLGKVGGAVIIGPEKKRDLIEKSGETLKEIKERIEHIQRFENRAETYDLRARKYAEELGKDLEKLKQHEKAKTLQEDINKVVGFELTFRNGLDDLKKYIEGLEKEADEALKTGKLNEYDKQAGQFKYDHIFNRIFNLGIEESVHKRLKTLKTLLDSILLLDEQIKKVILEAEAEVKK